MELNRNLPGRIVVCGDSISAGVMYDEKRGRYIKSAEGFVDLLQASLNCAVTNISRFGNTVATALPRLRRDLIREKPDIVLIELGGNDCDYKWDQVARDPEALHHPATEVGAFASSLTELIGQLREKGIAPVLTSLPPIDADRYFRWISRSGTGMAENILKWLGSVTRIYWWQEKYSAAVLSVAEATHTARIDLRGAFLGTPDFRRLLCADGIHPNAEGQHLICQAVARFINDNCPGLLRPAGRPAAG